ncbi:MAG TPA: DEAD/DEAH box helicase [Planctomycetota bacterium]|nr:DEAD/DEAH box helicase [Planctomycetota bacterium]
MTARFADYPFRGSLLKDIQAAGYETPLPIQAACIPHALEGKDLIGLAQTGTGKTAAFALPIIERVAATAEMGALVLTPTRELAQQVSGMFAELGRSSGIRVATVVGGIPIEKDWKALVSWPNVLVATPGRLIDHIQSGNVSLKDIKVLVIDEADRMHDMGFLPQIERILRELPRERQTLMFTATMPQDVEQIVQRNMRSPLILSVGRRSAPAERAQQQLFDTHESDKTPLLLSLLRETQGRVLVFVRTKLGVDRLARAVSPRHRGVARLHSNRAQAERDEALAGFREGRYRILIATDVAARGLDIADIEHVINYDFPQSPDDYVHRIGRTARVDATGLATSFVTRAERRFLPALERLVGTPLPLTPSPVTGGHSPRVAEGGRPSRRRGQRRGSSRRSPARAASGR